MNKSLHLIAGAAVVTLALSNVQASSVSITAAGYSLDNSIGASQPIGTDGYDVFDAYNPSNGGAITADVNPTYVSGGISTSGTTYTGYTKNYSTLTAYPTPSTPTLAGTSIVYYSSGGTVATFTLTGSVPQEFQIGLLGDNSLNNGNESDYTVTDSNSATATATTTDEGTGVPVNNFYFVDISNASAGDVISIVAVKLHTNGGLAGITFDTITPAPEPAALGLLSAGALGLLSRRRRSCRPLANATTGSDPSPTARDPR